MSNKDLLLVCKALWNKKDEVKQYIEEDSENAVVGCIATEVWRIEQEQES